MMLAHTYDENKISYPTYISEKLDGVPCGITLQLIDTTKGLMVSINTTTRQGNPVGPSIDYIVKYLALEADFIYDVLRISRDKEVTLWGELYVDGWAFKDISGAVRKQEPCIDLCLHVFDMEVEGVEDFETKYEQHLKHLPDLRNKFVKLIPHVLVHNSEEADEYINSNLDVEGYMYRNPDGVYKHTRSWDMVKRVWEKFTDLRIVDMLPAVDKHGEQKPMIGMFVMEDAEGKRYNVGPGKSTHLERKAWFKNFDSIRSLIAKVKHKVDETYKGLRQPTFQCLHFDKEEPDTV